MVRGIHTICATSRGSVSVIVTHEPCTYALDSIKSIYVRFGVRVPGNGCIVEGLLYHGAIGRRPNFFPASSKTAFTRIECTRKGECVNQLAIKSCISNNKKVIEQAIKRSMML